ncbi:hypothetical protein [Porphyromonas circumdentaria]|uniref:hypothetical protein n=1 Tax=Porphyromonas circumdentaria TaxID=29524 RepID=UPI0026DC726A|nr:hypothetical protein [Porphyromonas circumdentaria]MDO4722918.1 hypothetical protein [Porphyromonas circumdentaria]
MKQINKMKNLSLRKMSVAIATLFIVMFAMPFMAKAQTKYDLEIAGVKVTSNNCDDLSVIDGVSGTVEYNPDTNTLTLEDATIEGGRDNKRCIESGVENLTIVVKGTCNLSTAKAAISLRENTTITGGGTLSTASSTDCAIYLQFSLSLTIDGCRVEAKGEYGIAGYNGENGEHLTIKNATVTAEGTVGFICDLASLTLEGCKITEPAGAAFNESRHAVCDADGNIIKSKIVIKPTVKYDLEIAGVQVTSENCDDLSVIDGVSGTVEYNPDTNTLTLEDAIINAVDYAAIYAYEKDLTIVIKGICNATQVRIGGNTTITGKGTLSLKAGSHCGIYISNALLTIDGCRVEAKGKWGIAGKDGENGEHLTIKNATVTAEGTVGSICDLASLTLEGCKITEPAGAAFNKGAHAVCDAEGNLITSKVVIKPTEEVIKYNLKIAGVQVTSENCNDLSVIDGVRGTVKYNPSSNTLTLEDATIEVGDDKNCIFARKGAVALTIVIKGTCKLSSTTWSPVNLWRNTTISGDGELYAESRGTNSFNLDEGATLTIDRCRVDAKGVKGFSGFDQSSNAKLVIKNATVTAEGSKGSICDLASFTLEGCGITEPAGATFNEGAHAVCDADGNIIKSKIVIKPTEEVIEYDLEIAGVQVTSENCDDLSVIDGVSGTVEYNPSSNTLTLEDATIEVGGDNKRCIESGVENLTIVVKGTCNLSTAKAAISLRENTTITGGGTLSTASSTDCAIYLQFSLSLTIDGCRVEAKGEYGIAGYNGENGEHLTIKNATVTAEGTEGSICDLASLTLEGCKITEPAGAAFNESRHAVCDADGNVIKSKIVIKPGDPDAIERISLEEPAYRGIYNLLGIKLNIPFEQLPSGVYIVDGVKVFKK